MVFDAAIFYDRVTTVDQLRSPEWHQMVQPLLTPKGIFPFARYVVREKGKVELGNNACAFCHTRAMPDGTVMKGAQGNFAFDRAVAYKVSSDSVDQVRIGYRVLFAAPWLKERDPVAEVGTKSKEELLAMLEAIPAGALARHRSSAASPPAVPDLIGVEHRRYLDKAGLFRQRGIGDLMRYAALNNEMDLLSRIGEFIPSGKDYRTLPDPTGPDVPGGGRYSDEQLYLWRSTFTRSSHLRIRTCRRHLHERRSSKEVRKSSIARSAIGATRPRVVTQITS